MAQFMKSRVCQTGQCLSEVFKPQPHKEIPSSTRESIMSMMKEIIEKSNLHSDSLQYIPEESIEESILDRKDERPHSHERQQKLQINSTEIPLSKSAQSSKQSQSNEFSQLYQITQRCANYYSCFLDQMHSELQIIDKTFTDLNTNLSTAFDQIAKQLQNKHQQLKHFLHKKHQQILAFKNQQNSQLKDTLSQIQQLPGPNSQQVSFELHNYAATLNHFYTVLEHIQKSNFKQMVEDSVNFINNLVTEEIRVTLYEKIPSRLTEKHMIRQNSKDFLAESRNHDAGSDTFALLDIDSFTKLFLDHEQRFIENSAHKNSIEKVDKNEAVLPLIKEQKPKPNLRPTSVKKQTFPSHSPSKHTVTVDNCQNENELELIRKISYQQSNRSAKIKGYMVTFQDPKPFNQEALHHSKPETDRRPSSKSPIQANKTPTKLNKSAQKKPLTASVSMNQSSDLKLKNSSLRTSRQSTPVSQFKVVSSRRQSMVIKK